MRIMNKNKSKYFNTAKKMNDALIRLLDIKNFENITVKDVCKFAKVNRSTFYLHYQNTYDLLDEIIDNLNLSFHKHLSTDSNRLNIDADKLSDLFFISDKYLIPYLEFIKENKNIYKALRNNPYLFKANKTYEKIFTNVLSPIMTRFSIDEKWHKYTIDFYINGISSLILDWTYDDCKYSVNEISLLIKKLISNYDTKSNL